MPLRLRSARSRNGRWTRNPRSDPTKKAIEYFGTFPLSKYANIVTSAPPGAKNPCAAARCVFGLAFANSTPWMANVVGSRTKHPPVGSSSVVQTFLPCRSSWFVASPARYFCITDFTVSTEVCVTASGGCQGRLGYLPVWGYFDGVVAPALAANTCQCGSYPRGPRFFGVPGAPNVHTADMMIIQATNVVIRSRPPHACGGFRQMLSFAGIFWMDRM